MKSTTSQHTSQPMSLGRQTHLVGGIVLLTGIAMSLTISQGWIALSALPGFGMLLDAATGICPITLILKKMPWNRSASLC